MLAARIVVVGQDHHVGIAQIGGMLGAPLLGAARATGRRNIPGPQQVDLGLALDDQHGALERDRPDQLWESIRNRRHTVDIPDPFAGTIRIRSALTERLLVLAGFGEKRAIGGRLEFNALDHVDDGAGLVRILKRRGDDLPRYSVMLAVRLRFSRQRLACSGEINTIEMLDERDDVATDAAATAIEELFGDIDREAIVTTAFRTWAAALGSAHSLIPRRSISTSIGAARALSTHELKASGMGHL
jgi:hypothetical protein